MISQMSELAQVTSALFQVEQAKMQRIAAEETLLRQALTDLDAQYSTAIGDSTDMMAVRALGADLLWQVWVGHKRANLQMELAKILVRKAQVVEGLRQAFGKNHVAGQLHQREIIKKNQQDAAHHLRLEQDQLTL